MAGSDGENQLQPAHIKNLSVYTSVAAELAVGDKVMVTRNDKTLDVGERRPLHRDRDYREKRFYVNQREGREIELDQKHAYLRMPMQRPSIKRRLTCDRVLFNIDTRSLTTSKTFLRWDFPRPS